MSLLRRGGGRHVRVARGQLRGENPLHAFDRGEARTISASAAVCAATLKDGMSVLGEGGGSVSASDCLRGGDRTLRARVGGGRWSKWWLRRPSTLPLSSANGRVGGRGRQRFRAVCAAETSHCARVLRGKACTVWASAAPCVATVKDDMYALGGAAGTLLASAAVCATNFKDGVSLLRWGAERRVGDGGRRRSNHHRLYVLVGVRGAGTVSVSAAFRSAANNHCTRALGEEAGTLLTSAAVGTAVDEDCRPVSGGEVRHGLRASLWSPPPTTVSLFVRQ